MNEDHQRSVCPDLHTRFRRASQVVFGKNSDRPRREPQSVRRYERQRHEPGSVLKCDSTCMVVFWPILQLRRRTDSLPN